MRKFLTITLSVVALLAVVLAIVGQTNQPEPFPIESDSAQRLQPGPLEVHSHDELFIDTSRPTQAHGTYPGSDQRELQATIWHPADKAAGPYPLIVYSHGFSSNREGGVYIAEHLASYGYVVVAADYPLTNMDAPVRPYVRDVVNQPGDISFLIDSLLAQSADPHRMLYGMIDEKRIGVTGISLGGMTSTLVAFHPTMGDPRIGAALSIAGPTAQFTPVFFEQPDVPFLMLGGDIDALVPFGSNAAPVLQKVPGSQLVTVRNASHTGFAGPAEYLRWMNNPDSLGCGIVMRNIENDVEEPWFEQLGTPEQGIDYSAVNELCLMNPLPSAMNPLRQHMITAVVVRAFFDSHFAADAAEREASATYLAETLASEVEELEYAAAPPRA